ncbi:MAG TPA: UbiX family flavin prenyltransferase [Candidatus Angelobacter sp.]|jgi:4-hydroxy-3-polyprenylbenzoate decarboxylase|nr:UbiX family flavin prenyltransferase [Candidatus Angelobacter sp.]
MPDWTATSPWRGVDPPPSRDSLPVVVGISGASGSLLARATLRRLLARGEQVECVWSRAATEVWRDELGEPLEDGLRALAGNLTLHAPDSFDVPPASGSHRTKGMVVVPCSMTTAGGLANGAGDDLLKRCADVCIKESRRLVLVPRESPLSAIHLRNLAVLAELGVRIVPPIPPFYRRPQSLDDAVEQIVDRVLQALYD